jgi:putative addiction module component (TIGR02574 family)
MDYQTVLHEIASWPINEQVRLIQEVSDRLGLDGAEFNLTDEQRAEIRRRLREDDDVVSWDEVKAATLRRTGR